MQYCSAKEKRSFHINLYFVEEMDNDIYGFTIGANAHNDCYDVFLNSDIPGPRQLAAFLHEVTHIYNRDFDKTDETADQIEARTMDELHQALDIMLQGQ